MDGGQHDSGLSILEYVKYHCFPNIRPINAMLKAHRRNDLYAYSTMLEAFDSVRQLGSWQSRCKLKLWNLEDHQGLHARVCIGEALTYTRAYIPTFPCHKKEISASTIMGLTWMNIQWDHLNLIYTHECNGFPEIA